MEIATALCWLFFATASDADISIIGCGHLNYMREIEYLCRSGFAVLSYDNTGCDSSQGDDIRGLAQSLSDLNSCLDFIRADEKFKEKRIFAVGHSWGGYAVGNIFNYRTDIEKAVVLSGFASVELMVRQFLKGALSIFVPVVMRYERAQNPLYADSSSDIGLGKTSARVLIIQSEDDPMVQMNIGADYVRSRVSNENIKFITVTGKKHNPNYTEDAVAYLDECFSSLNKAIKSKRIKTEAEKVSFTSNFDWYRMTRQDDDVWREIIAFLSK